MSENFSAEERVLVRGQNMQPGQLKSLLGWYPPATRNRRHTVLTANYAQRSITTTKD